jgi:hypothetical protein
MPLLLASAYLLPKPVESGFVARRQEGSHLQNRLSTFLTTFSILTIAADGSPSTSQSL